MFIDKDINIENNIRKIIKVDDFQILTLLENPVIDFHESYLVPFQPKVIDFHNDNTFLNDNYFIFPMIPQYFHNFFEIFPKLLFLQQYDKNFKVILIHDVDKKTNKIFNSLLKEQEEKKFNASYLKDFFEMFDINFLCISKEEFINLKLKNIYVFFDDRTKNDDDFYFIHNKKQYYPLHFLKVQRVEVLLKDCDRLRNSFNKYNVVKNKKIYISRKYAKDRPFEYENDISNTLQKMGFEIVFLEHLSLSNQIKIIQESEYIVCAYGSALVNAIFCSSDNKILSINYTPDYYISTYDDIFNKYQISHKIINSSSFDIIINEIKDWINEYSRI